MKQPIDERSLDDYLNRGTEYSARYREVAADDVPPELDRAVLAQAAVMAQSMAAAKVTALPIRTWRRFTVPMTLAATVVIAVSVAINVSQAPARLESQAMETAASAAKSDAVRPESKVQERAEPEAAASAATQSAARELTRQESQEKQKAEASERRQRDTATSDRFALAQAPAAAAPPAKLEMKPAEADKVVVTGTFLRTTPEDAALPVEAISQSDTRAGPRYTVPPSPVAENRPAKTGLEEVIVTGSYRTATAGAAGPRSNVPASGAPGLSDRERSTEREASPQLWLEYIRSLRSVGRNVDANREWERFVKAYPTYPVAATDAARAKAPAP